MHLRASNASLLHVSAADISLRTPAIVLFSSSPNMLAAHDGSDHNTSSGHDQPPAPSQKSAGPGDEAAPWSRLSLDGGAVAVNATASAELETPGASLRLVGRRCNGDEKPGTRSSGCGESSGSSGSSSSISGSANGEKDGVGKDVLGTNTAGQGRGLGELVAEADAVLIRARSASAGVSIVADGVESRVGGGEGAVAGGGGEVDDSEDGEGDGANAGGRLEVKTSSDYIVEMLLHRRKEGQKETRLPFLLRWGVRPT